jgi:ADP-ribose diphosphatase
MVKAWKRVEPTLIHKVGWRTIVTKTFQLPEGSTEQFDISENESQIDVATVAITSEYEVLVFRQFRPGPEAIMDELPGGGTETHEGETEKKIEAAARRELVEETGYAPGEMLFLGRLSYSAYTNAWRHYFLATNCTMTGKGQMLEPVEKHGILYKISIDNLVDNARKGHMTDPGAVLLAYDKLIQLKEKSR